MLIVVTDLNLWLVFFLGPFFLSPCCKTDRFCWTADKFWFGGIVSSLVGCIKADQRLISQIAACSLHCCSTILYSATSLVLLTAITSTRSTHLNLATCLVLLSSTYSLLLKATPLWSASLFSFLITSNRSALLNSALVCSFLLFSSHLYFALLLYTAGAKCLCCRNCAK